MNNRSTLFICGSLLYFWTTAVDYDLYVKYGKIKVQI